MLLYTVHTNNPGRRLQGSREALRLGSVTLWSGLPTPPDPPEYDATRSVQDVHGIPAKSSG